MFYQLVRLTGDRMESEDGSFFVSYRKFMYCDILCYVVVDGNHIGANYSYPSVSYFLEDER